MKLFIFLSISAAIIANAADDNCVPKMQHKVPAWLAKVRSYRTDSELRSKLAYCLTKNYLDNSQVGDEMLKILHSDAEDVFVREDILAALARMSFRKSQITHKEDKIEKNLVPLTKLEDQYIEAMSEMVRNSKLDIELRIGAVQSLSNVLESLMGSGKFNESSVQSAIEVLRQVGQQQDKASYYSRASIAYEKVQKEFVASSGSRNIASEVK